MKRYFLVYILLAASTPSLYGMQPSLPARSASYSSSLSVTRTYPEPEQEQKQEAAEQPSASRPKKTCPICCDPLYDKVKAVIKLPCSKKHAFHYECIARAHAHINSNRTCPLCRAEMHEVIAGPGSIEVIGEQLEQEKTDRRYWENVAFFKEQRIQELLRRNENLAQQLLEEITEQQDGAPEYGVSQHPPRRGRKRNRKRRRYWHANNIPQDVTHYPDAQ